MNTPSPLPEPPPPPSRNSDDQEHHSHYRPCTASTTGDLLDCDCGHITDTMKITLLDLLDDHTVHTLDKSLNHDS